MLAERRRAEQANQRIVAALEAAGNRWSEWGERAMGVADILDGDIEPGTPIVNITCSCCGASLEVVYGDDEGEIGVIGQTVVRPAHPQPVSPSFVKALKQAGASKAFVQKVERKNKR